MKKYTQEELQEILKLHIKWLNDEPHGTRADLRGSNLSGAKGLLNPSEWLEANFKKTCVGYIVYKRIDQNKKAQYTIPERWKVEQNAILTEEVNYNRTDVCGCGISFGTLEWCRRNYRNVTLWQCLLPFKKLAEVCVPYNPDGKARCGYLILLQEV